MKLSKEKKQHLFLVALGSAIGLYLVWAFLIGPQRESNRTVAGKVEDLNRKLKLARTLIKNEAEVEAKLKAVQSQLQGLEEGMDRDGSVGFNLTPFAKAYGVDIESIPSKEEREVELLPLFTAYQGVYYTLHGKAFFHDFGRFVAEFENRFPYFRVQKIQLEPSIAQGVAAEKLQFSMQVVALQKPRGS